MRPLHARLGIALAAGALVLSLAACGNESAAPGAAGTSQSCKSTTKVNFG